MPYFVAVLSNCLVKHQGTTRQAGSCKWQCRLCQLAGVVSENRRQHGSISQCRQTVVPYAVQLRTCLFETSVAYPTILTAKKIICVKFSLPIAFYELIITV